MRIVLLFLLALFLSIPQIYAQEDSTKSKLVQLLDFSNGKPAKNIGDALISGRILLSSRFRTWISADDAFLTAYALTIGTNVGYMTQKFKGFQFYAEL